MSDRSRFESTYQAGDAPWDIGGPQPEVVALVAEGEMVGDVLDVGCGTGENALYLASLGRRVLGVDAAPTAVARAMEKAAARGLPAAFLVADALALGRLRRRFETVLDCGLFHTLDPEERRRYAESLCEVLSPGGTLHLLCFSDLSPDLDRPAERGWGGGEEPPGPGLSSDLHRPAQRGPGEGPRRIAQHELGDAFRGIFVITRLRAGRLESTIHQGGARAWVATLTRI